jgi:hypothetical protein
MLRQAVGMQDKNTAKYNEAPAEASSAWTARGPESSVWSCHARVREGVCVSQGYARFSDARVQANMAAGFPHTAKHLLRNLLRHPLHGLHGDRNHLFGRVMHACVRACA